MGQCVNNTIINKGRNFVLLLKLILKSYQNKKVQGLYIALAIAMHCGQAARIAQQHGQLLVSQHC